MHNHSTRITHCTHTRPTHSSQIELHNITHTSFNLCIHKRVSAHSIHPHVQTSALGRTPVNIYSVVHITHIECPIIPVMPYTLPHFSLIYVNILRSRPLRRTCSAYPSPLSPSQPVIADEKVSCWGKEPSRSSLLSLLLVSVLFFVFIPFFSFFPCFAFFQLRVRCTSSTGCLLYTSDAADE